ncbi:MAG TPA: DUF998 domain-containing protein [Rhodanobacteraceae bacterium]|nr:DUF998 domain-containing protein [Rhodanobacteraceae bacterium]
MLATIMTAIAAMYLFTALLVLASRKAGYSHVRHTISEIGESGDRHERFVAFGLFLPIGLLLLVVAYVTRPTSPPVSALALCIAAGYLGAALFPCDPGSPLSGSARQAVHNLAGAVEYIGGGFALMTIARDYGQPFQLAGFVVLGMAILMSVMPSHGRGILQRVAEICLFGCLGLGTWNAGSAA